MLQQGLMITKVFLRPLRAHAIRQELVAPLRESSGVIITALAKFDVSQKWRQFAPVVQIVAWIEANHHKNNIVGATQKRSTFQKTNPVSYSGCAVLTEITTTNWLGSFFPTTEVH